MLNLKTLNKNTKNKSKRPLNLLKKTDIYLKLINNLNKSIYLENKNKAKNIKLKNKVLHILFCFLVTETIIVFIFAILQGFKLKGFYLDEWTFRLVIFGTIFQITTMLRFVVKYLFNAKS